MRTSPSIRITASKSTCRRGIALAFTLSVLCGAAAGPGLSAPGALALETIAFPDLTDAARAGRKIPIKVHLPKTGGPYPVIVVSHGAGGNWDANKAQAEHLASYGYAVLCLEHPASNTQALTQGGRLMKNLEDMTRDTDEVLGRPKDVSFALDRAEEWNRSDPRIKGRLDLEHVGVLGHSYGAYTVMAICGIRPALDWLSRPVPPGHGLGPDLRDPRVKCGVALSPQAPGAPYFLPESYASLAVPLLGVSGDHDLQQGGITPQQRHDAFALWPPGQNIFIWIANASHLDFSDSGEKHGLGGSGKDAVQKVVRPATLLFFNLHLKGDQSAEELLTEAGLKPYLSGSANKVEVRKK